MVTRIERLINCTFLLVAFGLVGCVGDGYVYRIEPSDSFTGPVNIRLIPFDVERTDPYDYSGPYNQFIVTGPYWTQIFSDSETIDETFTIVKANLVVDIRYSAHWTYFIDGEFQCGGATYPISTQGYRSAMYAVKNAMRESIQLGISSAAEMAMQFLEACKKTGSSTDDIYSELTKINELREQGIISEEEFEVLKKKVFCATIW